MSSPHTANSDLTRSRPPVEDSADPRDDLREDSDYESGEGETPDDENIVPNESDRFAPESIRDTVVDVEKRCRVCGKNLKGHRRYKDSQGYICVDCDRDERLRRVPCAECGKPTLPEGLRAWGPISICGRCYADHEADPKLRVRRKVSTRQHDLYEKRMVLTLTAVVVAIFLVLLIGC